VKIATLTNLTYGYDLVVSVFSYRCAPEGKSKNISMSSIVPHLPLQHLWQMIINLTIN